MRRGIGKTIVLALAMAVAISLPAMASDITGFMYTPHGAPFSEVSIGANQTGNLTGFGQATSWAADPVGWYKITDLVGSTTDRYNLVINEKDHWGRMFVLGLLVPVNGSLAKDIRYDYDDAVTGTTWDGNLRNEWCQSFRATSTSIISAGMHQAIEFGPEVYVSIHEGGPTGPQIGPTRSFPTNIANGAAAYWSAGDVPTVPGKIYCVKFRATNGHRPFIAGAKIQNCDAFPEGRTWRDGVEVDTPMKCVIGQDDDGLITTISTKKTKNWSFLSTSAAGISFLANGTSFISVSCLVGSTGGLLQASVHNGVGTNGEGGPQIGPTKYFRPVDWNNRSAVVWAPGEVPLTPGNTYYVKIKRRDSGPFTIYSGMLKEYMNGTCYNNGLPLSMDYSTTVVCEAFPGSATMQKIGISGTNISRGASTATLSWNTAGITTEAYVEYGETTPYTNKKIASNGLAHTVTLTGLAPNTLYHARIVCKGNGYRDNYSRDFVFVTDPATTNLLTNTGFESGSLGSWTKFGNSDGVQSGDRFGCTPHTGTYFLSGATNGTQCRGGAYQRINVAAGRTVSVRAWLWTWQLDQLGATLPYTACGQIGIDPWGGTSPDATSIVWSPLVVAQNLFGDDKGIWTEVQVSAQPIMSSATVFLRAGADQAMKWTVYGFDDVVMTQEPIVTALTDLSKIKGTADGTYVSVPNLVVTASGDQVGAAYAEAVTRALGLRIESTDAFTVGHMVTVKGYLGTKASGERYIYSAKVLADTATTALDSFAVAAKSIGNVGPGSVGMLMTVAGEVKSAGAGYICINDGSMAGDGLKVMTSSLSSVPAVGKFVGITGIAQLESATVPVLWARSDADVVTYK